MSGYVQALPRSDATGILSRLAAASPDPRPDTLGEIRTIILDPQGHQVRQEYLSHLMQGPARATVMCYDNGGCAHYPPAVARSQRTRPGNDRGHHQDRQRSCHVLRARSRYATSALRSCCTPASKLAPIGVAGKPSTSTLPLVAPTGHR